MSHTGKRLSNEKKKITLYKPYKGRRLLEKPESRYIKILKDKRTLKRLKCFLCASMILSLSSSFQTMSSDFTYDDAMLSLSDDELNTSIDNIKRFSIMNCGTYYIDNTINKKIDIVPEIISYENLFIGDSRMQGMLLSGAISEENTIYGVGYGYDWFIGSGNFNSNKTNAVNGALNKLISMIEEDKNYNIIIWLGINDLKYRTASVYFNEFMNLSTELSNHNVYVVSVGPVSELCETSVSNEQINKFNQELKELILSSDIDNLKYIDLSESDLVIGSYDSSGIHYGLRDYRNIYDIIVSSIDSEHVLTR